jgi:hypothetical protein
MVREGELGWAPAKMSSKIIGMGMRKLDIGRGGIQVEDIGV